jgi:hypothetical protein
LRYKPIEFDRFKAEPGDNAFTLIPQQWRKESGVSGKTPNKHKRLRFGRRIGGSYQSGGYECRFNKTGSTPNGAIEVSQRKSI